MGITSHTTDPPITVLLPVGPGSSPAAVQAALGSVVDQSLPPAHVLVVVNGVNDPEFAALRRALEAVGSPVTRALRLGPPSLAAALNVGLRESTTDLVARMDADDLSLPDRLRVQTHLLASDPSLAGVGCAWEVVTPAGHSRGTMRPPTDPARLAWTLRLGNALAHGSMMLRRDAVLAAGGYDERLPRAQDYDLWLRLVRAGHRLGASERVLYRYVEQTGEGVRASSTPQALGAIDAMLASWDNLPDASPAERDAIRQVLGGAMQSQHGVGAREGLARLLDARPTRQGLFAWLWAGERFPGTTARAIESGRRARVREVAAMIRREGATRLWLWGAGQHTARLLEHTQDLGLPVAGIVDDHAHGLRALGFDVARPDAMPAGEHALLSSDAHEDAMWASSLPHRDRGVRVWRLYQ